MKKSIEKYVADYSESLSRLCASLTNNRHDAEDLFQSTWEKAIRKFKSYDSSKPFDKWLFTVCVNTFKDTKRRFDNTKIIRFSTAEEQENFLSSIQGFEEDRDEYLTLHNAIGHLSREKRAAIVLYYFRDFSVSELSEILGVPEGTVKSRLSSAREELRKELNDENDK